MAKQLNVSLNFTADTQQAKAQMQELQRQLSALGTTANIPVGKRIKDDIFSATKAAAELKTTLDGAINVNTGKLDLTKFSTGLKSSGKDLKYYRENLQKLGPEGSQAFLNLATAIQNAEAPLIRTNSLLGEMWTTMKNTARWQFSSSVLHSIQSTFSAALGYVQDLNESLNDIRIVTGQSVEQMADFAREANKAAKLLGTTTTRYTDAALIYYQQGLSDEEVQKRTDATVKMANVTGENAGDVSSYMTAIWNNFDDGSKSLEYYADVITKLGAETAASSEEIANGLEKFAAIGDTIGLSYEYATAALTTIIDKTRQSEDVVGTALKTIFARIQGLKVGETTEEGLDLNKYSKALNTYGIQIFDANNNLKDMDSILDDMGEKWQTLSRADKTALAQTVAGVRQYNQLMSLMDNWESMKENIISARNSEGTLQKQAEIYAESWEAASNKVRASMEELYNSIINDKFMIDMMHFGANAINTIDSVIDGLGGVKGMLLLISSILTTKLGPQMAQGLTSLTMSIGDAFTNGKFSTKIRQDAAQQVSELSKTSGLDENQVEYYRQIGILTEEYEANVAHMSELEKRVNQYLIDRQKILQNNSIQLKQQIELQEEQTEQIRRRNNRVFGNFTGDNTISNQQLRNLRTKALTVKNQDELNNFIENDAGELLANIQNNNSDRYVRAIESEIDAITELARAKASQAENDQKIVKGQEDAIKTIKNSTGAYQYWATTIVSAAQAVSSFAMVLSSISSINNVLQDDTLTDWEKFTSIATSLTMIIPMLINGVQGLSSAIKTLNAAQASSLLFAFGASDIKIIFKELEKNIGKVSNLTSILSKVMDENTAKTIAKKIAEEGLTGANKKLITSNIGLKLSLGKLGLALAAITVVIAGIVALVDYFTVSSKELAKSFDAYNEAKDNVQQLNDELKSLNEQIDELLKKGYSQLTDEEKEQLKVLREQNIELENQLALAKQLEKAKKQEFVDKFKERVEQGSFSSGKEKTYFNGNSSKNIIEAAESGQNFTNSLTSIKSYETENINQYKAELEAAFNAGEIGEGNYNLLLDKIALIQEDAAKKAEDLATDYEQAKAFLESGEAEKNTEAYNAAIDAVQRYYTYLGDAIDYKKDIVDLYGVSEEDLQKLQGSVDKEKDILEDILPTDFYEQLKTMSDETGLSIEFLADKLGLFKDSVNALTQENVFENFNKFISGKSDSEGESLDNVLNLQGEVNSENAEVNLGQNTLKDIFAQSGISLEEQQDILMNIDWANQSQAESIIQALQQIEELSNQEPDYSAEAEQLGYTEEQFEALTAAMMRNNEAYKDNEKGAQKAVIAQMRLQKALDKCYDTWGDYGDALKEADKSNSDYYEGLGQLAEDLTEGLGFEVDWSDVEDHLDLIKKAMEGDADAATELAQQLAFDNINTNLENSDEYFNGLKDNLNELKNTEFEKFESLPEQIQNLTNKSLSDIQNSWAEAQDYLDNNNLEVGEVVDDKYVDSLNDMIAASGMTEKQANDYLSGIGYEGELETIPVPMDGTHFEGNISLWDGKIQVPFSYTQEASVINVPQIKDGTLAKSAPKTIGLKNTKSGSQTKSSSGGGSKSKVDKVDKTKKSDIIDRYKEINDTLDDQSKKLDQLNKKHDRLYGKDRLKSIDKITKALKEENKALAQKKKEAKEYLKEDKKSMQSDLKAAQKEAGLKNTKFKFDKDGDISNYEDVMNDLYKRLRKKENEYNNKYAGKTESDASKAAKEKLDELKDKIDNVKTAISQYDETKSLVEEISEEIQDNLNEIQDNNYEKLSYEIELRITVNENDKRELEYYFNKLDTDIYKSAEALSYLYNKDGDNLVNNAKQALEDNSKAIEELNRQRKLALDNPKDGSGISQADYIAGLQEQLDSLYDNLEALQDLDNQMMEYYGNTLNKASEELSKYTDQMDHLTSVLEHYQKVLELTGKGQDYEAMDKVLQGQSKTLKNNFDVSKANYEMLEKEKKSIEEKISKMDQTSAAYELEKKKLEDITTATNEAYEEMLGDAESYLEALQRIWENSLENIKKKTSDALTGGLGFDILLDSMNNLKTYQDEYLTNTNKLFETNKLLSQIQTDIDKTSNAAAKQRYKAFSKEIEQLQKKDELSNLELEIAQAKYKQLQAQMALEEAQNAKSTVRLSRDNEGNYGYVYTADQNAVNDAQDALAQADNDLYNIRLNATNDYGEKMVQAQKEYIEKLAEIDKEYADDDVKRTEARKKAKEEYYNIIDTYSKLYSIAQQEDLRVQEDAWINYYDDIINKGDAWKTTLNDYTDQTEKKFQEWQTETKKVTDAIGLDMGTLSEKVKSVTDQSDALAKTTTEKVIPAMSNEIKEVDELTTAYGNQRDAIKKLIKEKEKLAKDTKKTIAEESGEIDENEWNKRLQAGKKYENAKYQGTDKYGNIHYSNISQNGLNNLIDKSNSLSEKANEVNQKRSKIVNERRAAGEKVYTDVDKYGILHYAATKDKLKDLIKEANAKDAPSFDTGGYTGKWGPEGKLAVLHEKELVLNQEDTNNLLKIIEIVRNAIDGNVASAGFGSLRAAGISTNSETLEQNVTITAEFPNATDHNEIEQAFDSLINRAAQFANRKK